jgi:hypothetical protein
MTYQQIDFERNKTDGQPDKKVVYEAELPATALLPPIQRITFLVIARVFSAVTCSSHDVHRTVGT